MLTITVTDDLVSGSASSGNQAWTNSAGGHIQVGASALGLKVADAQLAAYTRLTGDTLVFGREITTAGLLGPLGVLVNDLAGASVIYNWEADATVSGLLIVPDQLYQVDFTVTSGAGITVLDLLDYSTFGITTAGISGASNESAIALNLLDIASIKSGSPTGNFSFIFKSNQNRSALDFSFGASTGVGITGLGGTANNQNVLTFSGFQVTAIPEPSSLLVFGILAAGFILRRKRNS